MKKIVTRFMSLTLITGVLTGFACIGNAGGTNNPKDQFLTLEFDEYVQPGNGYIQIMNVADNSVAKKIFIVDTSQVFFDGKKIYVKPSGLLNADTKYYVTVDANAIKDYSDNFFAGISGKSAWRFDTGAGLITNIMAKSPGKQCTFTSKFKIRFNKEIQKGPAGKKLYLKNLTKGSVQSFDISNKRVSVFHEVLTILPNFDLEEATEYSLSIDPGTVLGADGKSSVGIADGAWKFGTSGSDSCSYNVDIKPCYVQTDPFGFVNSSESCLPVWPPPPDTTAPKLTSKSPAIE